MLLIDPALSPKMFRGLVLLSLFLTYAQSLVAQSRTGLPDHVLALAQIKGRMHLSLERMPNYTCLQTIERERLTQKAVRRLEKKLNQKSKDRTEVTFPLESTDTVQVELAYVDGRELYSWPGAEEFEDKTLGEMVGFGALSTGNFASTAHNLFQANVAVFKSAGREEIDGRNLLRFDFTVGIFRSGLELADASGHEAQLPYAGSIWADPETFDLVRIEMEAQEIPPYLEIASTSSWVDYQSLEVDGETFLLPHRAQMVTRLRSGAESRNRIEFSNCREFGASSEISFVPEDPVQEPDVGGAFEDFDLPVGALLRVRLTTAIDSQESKVGDEVQGRVESNVRINGDLVVPKGARVMGRIRRLERYSQPAPYHTVGIEISQLRFDGKRARFVGRMSSVKPVPGLVFGVPSTANSIDDQALSFGQVPGRIRRQRISTYEELTLSGVGVVSIQGSRFHLKPGLKMVWECVKTAPYPALR